MKRILVLDDEPDQHELVACLLIAMDIDPETVDHCSTASEAIHLLQTGEHVLLISDVEVPSKNDGITVAKLAKTLQKKVISVSGAMESLRPEVMARSAPDYCFAKPYAVSEVQKAVRTLLANCPPAKKRELQPA